ncbi:Uncharacterized protein TCM_012133 [Theobroma cacao]|uniref:Uncharacterized protein n=1 Tax=Theobroma cacao TaxID=3641 RepID=A0A061FUA2_THECC|nr:Uncharacterized protein TCM_012133 [Theobroma cacao]
MTPEISFRKVSLGIGLSKGLSKLDGYTTDESGTLGSMGLALIGLGCNKGGSGEPTSSSRGIYSSNVLSCASPSTVVRAPPA